MPTVAVKEEEVAVDQKRYWQHLSKQGKRCAGRWCFTRRGASGGCQVGGTSRQEGWRGGGESGGRQKGSNGPVEVLTATAEEEAERKKEMAADGRRQRSKRCRQHTVW